LASQKIFSAAGTVDDWFFLLENIKRTEERRSMADQYLSLKIKNYLQLAILFAALAGTGILLELTNLLDAAPWLHVVVIVMLDLFLLLGGIVIVLAVVRDRLAYYSNIDPLTGIMNRVSFWRILEREIRRVERYHHPLSMIMLDIDHFKAINDSRGSAVGDQVLKTMAEEIKKNIREIDFFARIGGEEFLILAPETDRERAANLAEKIRGTVEGIAFAAAGPVTVSLGVTQFCAGDRADLLLTKVDQALTQAKTSGRNRVVSN
jgi:diguanylate cyclase (GGDEF)-like protein